MSPRPALFALVLLSCGLATAAPWKNDSLRVRINFPGTWTLVTPKMAGQRMISSKDSADILFYGELKNRTEAGNFFLFEKSPKSKVRADLQIAPFGKIPRNLTEKDIKKLCPMWAINHGEDERPFLDCQPRKLGIAWTALLTYETEPGVHEYQIKYFRTNGTLILFTVAGTVKQAEAIFRNTTFY